MTRKKDDVNESMVCVGPPSDSIAAVAAPLFVAAYNLIIVAYTYNRKVPMVEWQVTTEPFETVAIDIVGPLPKVKGGVHYVLTYACMATRWTASILFRTITARAVADGLVEIFSRTSLPMQILSNRRRSVCQHTSERAVRADQIKTTACNPQANGVVERMHREQC